MRILCYKLVTHLMLNKQLIAINLIAYLAINTPTIGVFKPVEYSFQ
jgi:hypothetical protein